MGKWRFENIILYKRKQDIWILSWYSTLIMRILAREVIFQTEIFGSSDNCFCCYSIMGKSGSWKSCSQQKQARYMNLKHVHHSNSANTSQRRDISDKIFFGLQIITFIATLLWANGGLKCNSLQKEARYLDFNPNPTRQGQICPYLYVTWLPPRLARGTSRLDKG